MAKNARGVGRGIGNNRGGWERCGNSESGYFQRATVRRYPDKDRFMRAVIVGLGLVLLAGCSTFSETFDDHPRCGAHPYCGSSTDVQVISGAFEDDAGIFVVLAPLALIDLPFSVVADTLFLPYTAFHTEPADK
jgi:uncharacterized protein YceK